MCGWDYTVPSRRGDTWRLARVQMPRSVYDTPLHQEPRWCNSMTPFRGCELSTDQGQPLLGNPLVKRIRYLDRPCACQGLPRNIEGHCVSRLAKEFRPGKTGWHAALSTLLTRALTWLQLESAPWSANWVAAGHADSQQPDNPAARSTPWNHGPGPACSRAPRMIRAQLKTTGQPAIQPGRCRPEVQGGTVEKRCRAERIRSKSAWYLISERVATSSGSDGPALLVRHRQKLIDRFNESAPGNSMAPAWSRNWLLLAQEKSDVARGADRLDTHYHRNPPTYSAARCDGRRLGLSHAGVQTARPIPWGSKAIDSRSTRPRST